MDAFALPDIGRWYHSDDAGGSSTEDEGDACHSFACGTRILVVLSIVVPCLGVCPVVCFP